MHHSSVKIYDETDVVDPCDLPDLRTTVLEKLKEFRDHDVQRPVQGITIQQLR